MKLKDKNNKKVIYILNKKTKLKNIIVSNEDPYDTLDPFIRNDVWYSELTDDF